MSTTRYTMWYWYDQSCSFKTEDPNFSLNQLSKLVNAVQKEVNDETLVLPSQDPSGVAKRAMDSHTQSEEVSVSPWKVSVHRSDNGPINWVFCHAGPTTYFR
ncbi:hypothetical protein KXW35_000812 [Aspergillus fumigatus]|nr:hypothetical protein KXX61_007098 [Aspergillus fumigatus]KAH2430015.1 hypothetical protein KXW35_000812 [Aspergillus fumigatus]KAH2443975.1 hypothetical protein KXV21_006038 [Aspergillus fumigatus]KAH2502187.1 hypothetical protein KXW68_002043 [Aspergillus fumigatus]KAH2557270.1 hypothetical protein KXW48_007998 [Aspergillus fumigatus]